MRIQTSTLLALTLTLATLHGTQALAQAPLSLPTGEPLMERLITDAEGSRWEWGTFRVQPSLGIGRLGLINDVFADADAQAAESQSDFTANLFAGLNLYQILGDNSVVAFFVRPQYVWWQDLEDRRRLNVQAGAALAFDLNRVFLEGEAKRVESQAIATQEAEQLINTRQDTIEVSTGVKIYRSLALSVGYTRTESNNLLDEKPSALVPDFTRLDQTTEVTSLGFRLEPLRNTRLQIGYAEQTTDAATTTRNFEGDGLYFELDASREVVGFHLALRSFDLQPVGLSSFQPYDEPTGSIGLTFGTLRGRFLAVQADKKLVASVRTSLDDFESTRYSVTTSTPLSEKLRLQADYQDGERSYRSSNRSDDIQRLGASLQIDLLRGMSITARYQRSEVNSSDSRFDRNFNRFTVGFSVGLTGLSWP